MMRDLDKYLEQQITEIRGTVMDEKVLLALSGGVDSVVCAALISKAVPGQLNCIFADHGFMRLNEGDEVENAFKKQTDVNFIRVNAQDRFLSRLKGITEPEAKRKAVGEEFLRVFEDEAKKLGSIKYFAQGTIYLDVAESGTKDSVAVKSHHNVGGLPDLMDFKAIIEPLKSLYKNEVRALGAKLGLPEKLVNRQPFPGPGLAIRILGEVTKEKLDILRKADAIFREEIDKLPQKPSQYFAVLMDTRTVGVKDDARTYDYSVALRAINTQDFMSAEYVPLPHDFLSHVSRRITDEAAGVSRVVYDITGKPPGTIEWE